MPNSCEIRRKHIWYYCDDYDPDKSKYIIIQDTGSVELAYLYGYYHSLQSEDCEEIFDDATTARELGLEQSRITKLRKKLMKGGWVHYQTHVHKGDTYMVMRVGKADAK